MASSVSSITVEVKNLAEKVIAQVAAFAGYYAVLAHTDFTRIEVAAGAAITAGVGYVLNRFRGLKV